MKGIVALVDSGTFDESPFVYKDFNAEIAVQEGVVVEVVKFRLSKPGHLMPLVNVKG